MQQFSLFTSNTCTYQYQSTLKYDGSKQVFLVKEVNKNKLFILKKILKESLNTYDKELCMKREILIQMNLNHKNIVKLYETFEDDDYLYLITEYCSNGTLRTNQHQINQNNLFECFLQISDGLDYLHINNIIHRYINPENIYIESGCYKIGNFEWAIQSEEQMKPELTFKNKGYCAPELQFSQIYDQKVDIWSLGIVIFELLHHYNPEYNEVIVNEKLDEDLQILLYAMLSKQMNGRPSCQQLYLCKWFKKMMKKYKIFNKYENEQLKSKQMSKQVQVKTLMNCCFSIKQASISTQENSLLQSDSTAPMIPNSIQTSVESLHEAIPAVESPAYS